MRLSTLALCAAIAAAGPLIAQERPVDTQRSTITIHVGKSGLLSGAAHDHTVNAPISSGSILESGAPHIEFRVETAKMTVLPDPKINADDQATIQTHMEEMTLETKKFPEITFRSSRVQKRSYQSGQPDREADRRIMDDTHRSQTNRFRH
jgi:polyisoprenoid-binding protein YceI